MIMKAPPSAACPPNLNGMTCRVMFGSAMTSISRSICATWTSRPPIGRRSAASSTIAQNLGVSARLNGGTHEEIDQRIEEMLELFPELAERRKQPARAVMAPHFEA